MPVIAQVDDLALDENLGVLAMLAAFSTCEAVGVPIGRR